ncbi:MAG: zinc ribbon domain-containing protein [Clostridia bacterium]|nr:zinc ribbon domain-containing protein [Clostridia bacterium]
MKCQRCGAINPNGAEYCAACGNTFDSPDQIIRSDPYGPKLGMKWFNFLIYFALFAGAFSNVINALTSFAGSSYEELSLFYPIGDGVRILDVIFGIVTILLAAYLIFVRFALSKFKEYGPAMLIVAYLIAGISSVVYAICLIAIVGTDHMSSFYFTALLGGIIGEIITTGLLVSWNVTYFTKRSHLFVN